MFIIWENDMPRFNCLRFGLELLLLFLYSEKRFNTKKKTSNVLLSVGQLFSCYTRVDKK